MDSPTLLIGILSIFATMASGFIGKYGIELFGISFWRPKFINVIGTFHVFGKAKGDCLESIDDPHTTQTLDAATLKIRGKEVTLDGNYHAIRHGGTSVEGRFIARGLLHNGEAYLTYEIRDKKRGQHPFGTLLLYITEWGDMVGYFSVKSVSFHGFTVFATLN